MSTRTQIGQDPAVLVRAVAGRWIASVAVLVLAWLFVWIRLARPEFGGLDAFVLKGASNGSLPGNAEVLAKISRATNTVPLGMASVVVGAGLALAFSYRRAVLFLGMVSFSAVLVSVLKVVAGRERPEVGAATLSSLAWPSGHSAGSMTFGLAVVLALYRVGRRPGSVAAIVLIPGAFLVGYSRIFLSVHWFSDVLAGWAVSLLALGVVLALDSKVDQPDRSRPVIAYGSILLAVSLMVTMGLR